MTELPYNGTEGHSGTATSEDRAERQKLSASERQKLVLALALKRESYGITVAEVRQSEYSGLAHHGTASATLTVLHKAGLLRRLVDTRDGCKIYVTPEHVAGRKVETFVGNREKAQIDILADAHAGLAAVIEHNGPDHPDNSGLTTAMMLLRAHQDSLIPR